MRLLLAAMLFLSLAGVCLAGETAATTPAHATTAHTADPHPHPAISEDAGWVRPMVIVIGVMFVAAAAVGIVIRSGAPEVLPVAHSHDESHGSTHH